MTLALAWTSCGVLAQPASGWGTQKPPAKSEADAKATASIRAAIQPMLDAYDYKPEESAECMPYFELLRTVSQLSAKGSTLPTAVIENEKRIAISRGIEAGCYVPKTLMDKLSPTLKSSYEKNVARLEQFPQCAQYGVWAKAIIEGPWRDHEKELSLAKLFFDAAEKKCLR